MPSEEQSVPEEKPPLKRNLPLAVVSLTLATALTGTTPADVAAMITDGRLDRRPARPQPAPLQQVFCGRSQKSHCHGAAHPALASSQGTIAEMKPSGLVMGRPFMVATRWPMPNRASQVRAR